MRRTPDVQGVRTKSSALTLVVQRLAGSWWCGRRLSAPNGLIQGRLPSCPEAENSSWCSPPISPKYTLADGVVSPLARLRLGVRAKKLEKMVQARALIKERLVAYCAHNDQQAEPEDAEA
ncbi:hypothetical protein T484DRAFT_1851142 [Baffinella frigidus]|nr:hypothetical protein T484DRAFT_1851142 [Cryptophyta sp. CCMP2293]